MQTAASDKILGPCGLCTGGKGHLSVFRGRRPFRTHSRQQRKISVRAQGSKDEKNAQEQPNPGLCSVIKVTFDGDQVDRLTCCADKSPVYCNSLAYHLILSILLTPAGAGLKAVWYGAEQFGNVIGLAKPRQGKAKNQPQVGFLSEEST